MFSPQHLPVPFANRAHVCQRPAEIAATFVRLFTTTGVAEAVKIDARTALQPSEVEKLRAEQDAYQQQQVQQHEPPADLRDQRDRHRPG